jgi:hypothetical protein
MEKSAEILNELKTLAPALAEVRNVNVFTVPEGYFKDLDKRILTIVFLQQDEKNYSQQVPEGYFNSLSDKILSRIKETQQSAEEEIKELSPALHYLKQENVFTIPENYFDDLSDRIKEKVKPVPGKVISINRMQKWWKYAAAAIVAGIITVTSFEIYNNGGTGSKIPPYIQLSAKYKTAAQFEQGISSLSSDEIASYLEKNTTILDDESLINNTNTKELPAPDDYLINENTLENYLKTINAEGTITNTQ